MLMFQPPLASLLFLLACSGDPTPGSPSDGVLGSASITPAQGASFTRVGTLPVLETPAPERLDASPCGWKIRMPRWGDLGSRGLEDKGLPDLSPVELTEDGVPLTRRTKGQSPARDQCDGIYSFTNRVIAFSPTGDDPDAAKARTYAARATPDLPLVGSMGEISWWVYPGTSVQIVLGRDAPTGAVTLHLRAHAATGGKGVPGLSIGDAPPGKLTASAEGLDLSLPGIAAGAGTQLTLTVPPDGPWLLVEDLLMEGASGTLAIIGDGLLATTTHAAQIATTDDKPEAAEAGSPTTTEARLMGLTPESAPTITGTLPEIPSPAPIDGNGPWGRISLPAFAHLSDSSLKALGGSPRSSPLLILEQGRPLSQPNARCSDVRAGSKGAWCHANSDLLLTSQTGGAPAASGRSFAIGLDPGRSYHGGWWLYPGDTLSSSPRLAQLEVLKERATHLVLGGLATNSNATGHLQIELRGPSGPLLTTSLLATALNAGPQRLALDTPIGPPWTSVELVVRSEPEADFVVLTSATLAGT